MKVQTKPEPNLKPNRFKPVFRESANQTRTESETEIVSNRVKPRFKMIKLVLVRVPTKPEPNLKDTLRKPKLT